MEIRQSSSSQRATCIKDHNSHYLNHLINSIKHHSFPHSLSLSQSYNQLSTFPTHQYSITAKQTTHKLPISSITTIQLHHFPLKPSTSRIHLSQDTSLFIEPTPLAPVQNSASPALPSSTFYSNTTRTPKPLASLCASPIHLFYPPHLHPPPTKPTPPPSPPSAEKNAHHHLAYPT
jgi:hypothetical protein